MRITVKQLNKNYDFNFPVYTDIAKDVEGITANWDDPLTVAGRLKMLDESTLEICFTITGKLEYPCSRCLDPVEMDVEYTFDEEINDIDGDQIDISEYVLDCLYINEPSQILCKENCLGICPICGVNRNVEACSCQEDLEAETIDPRLEALKDFVV